MFKNSRFYSKRWFVNDSATQLFCVLLKANEFSKTERKKLQTLLISKFEKLFIVSEFSSYLTGLFLPVNLSKRETMTSGTIGLYKPVRVFRPLYSTHRSRDSSPSKSSYNTAMSICPPSSTGSTTSVCHHNRLPLFYLGTRC